MSLQGGSQGNKSTTLALLLPTKCLPVPLSPPALIRNQRAREPVNVNHESQVSGAPDEVRKRGGDLDGKTPFDVNFSFFFPFCLLTSKEGPKCKPSQEMSRNDLKTLNNQELPLLWVKEALPKSGPKVTSAFGKPTRVLEVTTTNLHLTLGLRPANKLCNFSLICMLCVVFNFCEKENTLNNSECKFYRSRHKTQNSCYSERVP